MFLGQRPLKGTFLSLKYPSNKHWTSGRNKKWALSASALDIDRDFWTNRFFGVATVHRSTVDASAKRRRNFRTNSFLVRYGGDAMWLLAFWRNGDEQLASYTRFFKLISFVIMLWSVGCYKTCRVLFFSSLTPPAAFPVASSKESYRRRRSIS